MLMSDVFNLPVSIEKIHLDDSQVARQPFVGDGGECKAVNLAINNHDALVEALSELLEFNKTMGKDFFGEKGYCPYCDQSLSNHGEGCIHSLAINLLDKIKGKSK